MLNIHDYLRGFIRLSVVAGILLASWTFAFLAIYGAVRLDAASPQVMQTLPIL